MCKQRFAASPLDGEGARLAGGRWNRKGTRLAYCSESLSLAALELIVNLPSTLLPDDLVVIEVQAPDALPLETWTTDQLPVGWNERISTGVTQALGDTWLRSRRSLLLRVPSVVIPWESNVLINPEHRDASKLRVINHGLFPDQRLVSV